MARRAEEYSKTAGIKAIELLAAAKAIALSDDIADAFGAITRSCGCARCRG
jgi:hypothetical protein